MFRVGSQISQLAKKSGTQLFFALYIVNNIETAYKYIHSSVFSSTLVRGYLTGGLSGIHTSLRPYVLTFINNVSLSHLSYSYLTLPLNPNLTLPYPTTPHPTPTPAFWYILCNNRYQPRFIEIISIFVLSDLCA